MLFYRDTSAKSSQKLRQKICNFILPIIRFLVFVFESKLKELKKILQFCNLNKTIKMNTKHCK